jgi:TRAP transporter TAXI family solute receptor
MQRRAFIKTAAGASATGLIAGFAGCSGQDTSNQMGDESDGNGGGADPTRLGISTASQGASHYNMSSPIPDLLEEHSGDPPLRATVRTSEGSVANMRKVGQMTTEIGTAVAPVAFQAANGAGSFDEELDVELLMQGESVPQYHVVREDSDITSVMDLEGKTVTAGPSGSGLLGPHRTMMDLLDINVEYEFLGYSEGGRALLDGDVDAWWIFHGSPPRNVFSSAPDKLKVLEFSEDELQPILDEFPFISKYQMADDMLPGMEAERLTWTAGSFWTTNPDAMSADAAREFVEVVCEHPGPIQEANINSRNFGPEFAYSDIGIPYHEGAEQYFSDKGVI